MGQRSGRAGQGGGDSHCLIKDVYSVVAAGQWRPLHLYIAAKTQDAIRDMNGQTDRDE